MSAAAALQFGVGSKHAVPRRLIKIESAKEVPAAEVEDAVVRHMAGLQ